MTPESIKNEANESMDKAVDHLRKELRGIRTGRASTALVDFVKVDYYGSMQDLKNLAATSTPEATQILIQPFDPSAVQAIKKGIEEANIGLTPNVDGKVIRISVPALSTDRRKQLAAQVKKLGEDAKVSARNVRRDANKHADQLAKDKDAHLSEDQISDLKDEIQNLIKKHEAEIEELVSKKTTEVLEV
ncbi:MAG: ribosome recycling factor [Planctomycetota bacterium]